jgi:Zn-dependent M28 family amino/carboxypeptidase
VRRAALWAALALTAAAATGKVLVEIEVADAGDFEALRLERPERFRLVGGFAYAAVGGEAARAFDAGGRGWTVVAASGEEEAFLVLPASASYGGPRLAVGELSGGNVYFVLTAADAAALIPLYAFNVVDAPRATPAGMAPAAPFDPLEAGATDRVRGDRLMATATRLQDFYSRYVYFRGNDAAAAFLEDEYREVPRAAVERQYFSFEGPRGPKRAANVVARVEGVKYPDQQVVVGAHFDSITHGSAGEPGAAAPGADDNASGAAAVLECARVLSWYAFDRTLVFVCFNAEELGLFGSEHYAGAARERGDDVRAMINLDMVAYEPDEHFDADVYANAASSDLAEIMAAKAARYTLIEMTPYSNGPEYSDHASFWHNDYKAIWQFEGANDQSPHIHTPDDTVETLNSRFFADMTRALVATAFNLAGANPSPLMGIVEPDGAADFADDRYAVQWWDVDADDFGTDATISLYGTRDDRSEGGTLIADGIPQNDQGNRGSHEWDTSSLPPGRYYVYGVIDDGVNRPYTAPSAGPVYVTHESRVVAYPNPLRAGPGQGVVTFDGLLPGDTVVVYDLAGTKIFEAAASGRRLRWNAAAVAGGVYLYRIESAVKGDAITGKVAVLR